jgi:hypothetical protein
MVASMCIAGGSRSLREVSDARVLQQVLAKAQAAKFASRFALMCSMRLSHV